MEDDEVGEMVMLDTAPGEDPRSVITAVFTDHDRIKGLHKRLLDPGETAHTRQLLAWQLMRELTVHSYAEEEVLYPAVADSVEQHMRDHAVDEHDSLKLFISDLEGMKVGDAGFADKMHQLMEAFLEHIQEEEHRMLPALRAVCDATQLRELGKRFEACKSHLPTSPHPPDPKHPSRIDAPAVLIDAARDAARFEGTPPPLGSPSTEVLRGRRLG